MSRSNSVRRAGTPSPAARFLSGTFKTYFYLLQRQFRGISPLGACRDGGYLLSLSHNIEEEPGVWMR